MNLITASFTLILLSVRFSNTKSLFVVPFTVTFSVLSFKVVSTFVSSFVVTLTPFTVTVPGNITTSLSPSTTTPLFNFILSALTSSIINFELSPDRFTSLALPDDAITNVHEYPFAFMFH